MSTRINIMLIMRASVFISFFLSACSVASAFDQNDFLKFCNSVNYKFMGHQTIIPLVEKYRHSYPIQLDEYSIKNFKEVSPDSQNTYSRYLIHIATFDSEAATAKQEVCYLPKSKDYPFDKSMYAMCEGFRIDAQIFEVMTDGYLFAFTDQKKILEKLKLWVINKK